MGHYLDAEDRRIIRICTVCDPHVCIYAQMHGFVYDMYTRPYAGTGRYHYMHRTDLPGGVVWWNDYEVSKRRGNYVMAMHQ